MSLRRSSNLKFSEILEMLMLLNPGKSWFPTRSPFTTSDDQQQFLFRQVSEVLQHVPDNLRRFLRSSWSTFLLDVDQRFLRISWWRPTTSSRCPPTSCSCWSPAPSFSSSSLGLLLFVGSDTGVSFLLERSFHRHINIIITTTIVIITNNVISCRSKARPDAEAGSPNR